MTRRRRPPRSSYAPGPSRPAQHGMRLDRALSELVPEFSRSYLQQLIEAGAVTRDGQALRKPAHKVRAGEQGLIELRPTPQSQAFLPEAMALDIVHEDEHLLVLNKPAGLVVHPAPGNWRGTLLNGLLAHDAKAAQLPRAGIVHRLDKDTSGLMVVARTRATMDALVQADRRARGQSPVPGAWRIRPGAARRGARSRAPSGATRAIACAWRWWTCSVTPASRPGPPSSCCTTARRAAGCAARCIPDARTRSACMRPPSAIRWWRTRSTAAPRRPACSGRPCMPGAWPSPIR